MNRKRATRSLRIWPQTGPPSIQQNVYAVSRERCYKSDDASTGVENNCRSNKVHTRIALSLSYSSRDVLLQQGQPGVTRLVAKCGQSQRPSGKRLRRANKWVKWRVDDMRLAAQTTAVKRWERSGGKEQHRPNAEAQVRAARRGAGWLCVDGLCEQDRGGSVWLCVDIVRRGGLWRELGVVWEWACTHTLHH